MESADDELAALADALEVDGDAKTPGPLEWTDEVKIDCEWEPFSIGHFAEVAYELRWYKQLGWPWLRSSEDLAEDIRWWRLRTAEGTEPRSIPTSPTSSG